MNLGAGRKVNSKEGERGSREGECFSRRGRGAGGQQGAGGADSMMKCEQGIRVSTSDLIMGSRGESREERGVLKDG